LEGRQREALEGGWRDAGGGGRGGLKEAGGLVEFDLLEEASEESFGRRVLKIED
jgi:hypothetical protein